MGKARWTVLAVALVAVLLVVVGWLLADTRTPIAVDEVQARFQGETGSEPGDPGVYRYRTTGFEEIDALAGARHDYPAETYMTISAAECGPVVRWDALAERWIEWFHCGSDLSITETIEYHEWFGIPDEEVEECPESRPVFGAVERIVCVAATTSEAYEVAVVGTEILEVAGQPVQTLHIRRTSTLSGGSNGSTVADVWRLVDTPLIVRMRVVSNSATPSAVGDVNYVEEFNLELVRLVPAG